MSKEMYQVVADENELHWFFEHTIFRPQPYEAYSMVFVSRHKKLTDEEAEQFGVTRREAEWMASCVIRPPKFKSVFDKETPWTAENFIKHVKRFNVDKGAYTTSLGTPIPEKTLAVIFYINPCDMIKVGDEVIRTIEDTKTCMTKALINVKKDWTDVAHMYQTFANMESSFKHYMAHCKGSKYWMDFDVDVPEWFKTKDNYYQLMKDELTKTYEKGNYLIIRTSGGYHILVRTCKVHSNPNDFCKKVKAIYEQGIKNGEAPYIDEKGDCKFEAILNNAQIPGIPLPGTYQYGNPVVVLNKEDFN